MRNSALTYRGALKILGSTDGHQLTTIDTILGGAILGTGAIGLPMVFALVDQKNEATKLARRLANSATARLRRTTGYSRHQLISAAHTTIAIAAAFDEFSRIVDKEIERRLELTDAERIWIAGTEKKRDRVKQAVDELLTVEAPMPTPASGFEVTASGPMARFYFELTARLIEFVQGLNDAELLHKRHWKSLREELPSNALQRYRDYYLKLAVDVPEFCVWAMLQGQAAAENCSVELTKLIRQNSQALEKVQEVLNSIAESGRLDEQARLMNTLNSAYLGAPLAQADLTLDGLSFPTVEEGYVTPRYRVAVMERRSNVVDQAWWDELTVRGDLDEFLIGYLSSPDASSKPLVVLGHPGAGKSMLTKIVAARLPTNLFSAACVPLRHVDPDAPVHRQIEQAINDATNGRVSWLGLSEASRDLTRVVLLDGLDELMQATGVVQSRYIDDLVEFQQREQQLGRPLCHPDLPHRGGRPGPHPAGVHRSPP